jgi:hypothetical protein
MDIIQSLRMVILPNHRYNTGIKIFLLFVIA